MFLKKRWNICLGVIIISAILINIGDFIKIRSILKLPNLFNNYSTLKLFASVENRFHFMFSQILQTDDKQTSQVSAESPRFEQRLKMRRIT